ncbi:hypothetical protein [Phenylobacterium sp.]|uniref:PepSY domain-containing protein n=1 Tax=Phenylobacterium sp. TaxID=1871053 RepID=UPI002DEC847B|nr:hypothetical protein [Phenylobacterium sp.]
MMFRMAIAALLLATAAPASAFAAQDGRPSLGAGRGDQDEARAAVRAGRQIPLSRVIPMIAARNKGAYLNTTTGDQGGRPVYLVQWRLPDGRVVVFIVDAESGAMLGQQGG